MVTEKDNEIYVAKKAGRKKAVTPFPRAATSSRGPTDLVLLINAVLVGVGGVFIVTTSVVVTVVAAAMALILAVVIVLAGR